MREKFRNFMAGRYGFDQLGIFMVGLGIFFAVLGSVLQFQYISILTWALLILVYMRVFSRNTYKRSAENQKYLELSAPLRNFFKKAIHSVKLFVKRLFDREHKYFKCPGCGAELRVPKKRGKLRVTCPKCGAKTEVNT